MTTSHKKGVNPLQALATVRQSPWLDFICGVSSQPIVGIEMGTKC